jgi:hypothetical protein
MSLIKNKAAVSCLFEMSTEARRRKQARRLGIACRLDRVWQGPGTGLIATGLELLLAPSEKTGTRQRDAQGLRVSQSWSRLWGSSRLALYRGVDAGADGARRGGRARCLGKVRRGPSLETTSARCLIRFGHSPTPQKQGFRKMLDELEERMAGLRKDWSCRKKNGVHKALSI